LSCNSMASYLNVVSAFQNRNYWSGNYKMPWKNSIDAEVTALLK
ncbi:17662_t:CDS:1, partial [Funneliformis geosporum]